MAPRTGDRYRIPIPIRENEIRATGSGPVTTRKATPEELAWANSLPTPSPRDKLGEQVNRPVAQQTNFTSEEQRRRANKRYEEGEPMPEQVASDKVPFTPNKVEFLKHVASGKSISKFERAKGMGNGAIYYWLNKWELKGIKPDRAQQLLDEMALDGAAPVPMPIPDREPKNQAEYRQKLSDVIGERNQFRDLYSAVEAENMKLRNERDDYMQAVMDLEAKLDRQADHVAEIDRLKAANAEVVAVAGQAAEKFQTDIACLKEEIEELMADRQVLLATIEQASTPTPVDNDPVNHPAHYTAGGIECIDAIDAATVMLSGGRAYSTGAAIKYLWRWSLKGGAEDLRKARWYVDWLIAEVEGVSQAD